MSVDAMSGGGAQYRGLHARSQHDRGARFEASDVDKSGGLSLDEFKSARANNQKQAENIAFDPANSIGKPKTEDVFARLDADGNGEVTKVELSAGRPKGAGSGFSSEMMTSLLSLQEVSDAPTGDASSQSSLLDILDSSSSAAENVDVDLTSTFLDSLNSSDDGSEQ